MSSVIAKFSVQTVEHIGGKDYRGVDTEKGETPEAVTSAVKINMAPVYAPKDAKCENAKFWDATPSGQLWMQINNPAAFAFFEPGAEYYLTFVKA